jgi:nickel/cobalt transporter (NicO) family protein
MTFEALCFEAILNESQRVEPAALHILLLTALWLGLVHTLLGPDHYLPFVMMSRAANWGLRRTLLITLSCGIAHVLGSVLLGCAGVFFGLSLSRLQAMESQRGDISAWLLTLFGLVYFLWALRWERRHKRHEHRHCHDDGVAHAHPHGHHSQHAHAHGDPRALTPWVLFTVFVFGPCEPLIPLVMYPAAHLDWRAVFGVTLLFGGSTVAAMLITVTGVLYGFNLLPLKRLEHHIHAIAGLGIMLCGVAILQLGL